MDWWLSILVFALVVLGLKLYAVSDVGKCTSKRKLHGKTVIVTGASRGIGFYTALDLAKRGARVIVTSEIEEHSRKAKNEIIALSGNPNIVAKHLDFRSLKNTREFAKDIIRNEERLDVLVNNAGTAGLGNVRTEDGLLAGLQVNYFGPFLLTLLLIDLLKKSGRSRIVNVASLWSHIAIPDLFDIDSCPTPVFSNVIVYANSKLFLVYMTWELARRLKGTDVTVNCLHPGYVYTSIWTCYKNKLLLIRNLMFKYTLGIIFFKTVQEGAQTSIYLAVSEEVEEVSGYYFADCRKKKPHIKRDQKAIRSVWQQSIKLVKLEDSEISI